MTIYVHVAENGTTTYPYSAAELRRANPKVLMRDIPSDETLAGYGMFPVEPTAEPTANDAKNVTRGVQFIDGRWKETWTVTDAPADVVTRRFADRKREKWERVKERRDRIIDESFGVKAAAAQTRALELGAALAAASDRQAFNAIDITAGWP